MAASQVSKPLDPLCANLREAIEEVANLSEAEVNFIAVHGNHEDGLSFANMLLAVNNLMNFRMRYQGKIALKAYQTGLKGAVSAIQTSSDENPRDRSEKYYGKGEPLTFIYDAKEADCVAA